MAEEKFLCGLDYKSLNFTDAQYEKALEMIGKPVSANQLLLALLEISQCDDTSTTPTNTRETATGTCYNTNSNIQVDRRAGFKPITNMSLDKDWASSGYSSTTSFHSSSSNQSLDQVSGLRKIYIDGSNVARTHGKVASFSWIGIQICVEWFHSRQHRVKVIIPEERCNAIANSEDAAVLDYLDNLNALIKTPSGCNDDFFIIDAARQANGIIVSNDQYREEKARLDIDCRRFIEFNRLPYSFNNDHFMPAIDPRGRSGPLLNDFLKEAQPHRQRYQRNGISRRGQSQYNGVSNHSRLKSTYSLPTSFMNE